MKSYNHKNMKSDLERLCSENGRYISFGSDGKIYTANKYDGTDGRQFTSVEEALTWERGYCGSNIKK